MHADVLCEKVKNKAGPCIDETRGLPLRVVARLAAAQERLAEFNVAAVWGISAGL